MQLVDLALACRLGRFGPARENAQHALDRLLFQALIIV
jgi:hypothetical protein